MKHISDLNLDEVKVLFKIAGFDDFTITRLENNDDEDGIIVCANSEWTDGEEDYVCEDAIVELFPTTYKDISDFEPGFTLPQDVYIQWAIWCNLIKKIDFDRLVNV